MNPNLHEAIEQEAAKSSLKDLTQAREDLTERYRDRSQSKRFMTSDAHRKAYILSRMPATYGVVKHVLQMIGEHQIESMIDLGAGPGTATWAAHDVFSSIKKYTLIEQDADTIALGKRLASGMNFPATWQQGDLKALDAFPAHDLVVISYAIGELPMESLSELLTKWWASTNKMLVVIEPGTMHGFSYIRKARQELIDLGAFPVAPCPHANACPMPANDWCHFSERIDRTSMHRKMKGGSLGYEDEKYSYFIASKTPVTLPDARILRHPDKHSGHIRLNLCTPEGLQNVTVSRRDGDLYKKARKLEWGDAFPPSLKDNPEDEGE